MRNELRWLAVMVMSLLVGCGPGMVEDLPEEAPAGQPVADDGTGDTVADPDPGAPGCEVEPCDSVDVDADAGVEVGVEEVDAGVQDVDAGVEASAFDAGSLADAGLGRSDGGVAARPDAGAVDAGLRPDAGHVDAGPNPWAAGAKVLVRGYVSFRTAARADAGTLNSIDPAGGVTDSAHSGGMPRGLVPPGQGVTLVTGTRTNGFYQVRYAGQTGWISASWLAPLDPTSTRYETVVQPPVRNAFFKHQLHRTRWNKDGPSSSGTCAPTSLAMAVHAFGKEPAGLSVEESIHRVRQSYGATTDSTGTFRAQITAGARALGMSVRVLDTRLSLADMLTRIDGQLAAQRMVVLEGQPTSAYQLAFDHAYQAASLSNHYTFGGRHTIVVIGKEGTGYVVGDPLSEVGMVKLTGAELKAFFTTWGGTGNAVWAP